MCLNKVKHTCIWLRTSGASVKRTLNRHLLLVTVLAKGYNHVLLLQLEQELERSETALKSLKKHLDRKTCPKSLQYRARACIKADDDFKKDIKRLRSKGEQDYIQVLIRFHNRNMESSAIRQGKRVQANKSKKKQKNIVNKKQLSRTRRPKKL